jgi:hypothetical protein
MLRGPFKNIEAILHSEVPEGCDMAHNHSFAGSLVMVRSPQEILSTLDFNGALDCHPFMPEMLKHCGKIFRVHRRVEKTCVETALPINPNRCFAQNDVVTLEALRCDGSAHDGCMRGCRIYWKEAWLRPAGSTETDAPVDEFALQELSKRLKIKADSERYFCQSTELLRSTHAFPGKAKLWLIRIALRQIRQGDRSAMEMAELFLRWLKIRIHKAIAGDNRLRGPCTHGTPVSAINLKPGELVRIKPLDQIVATLDRKIRNRGLGICHEMTLCCGELAEVRYPVTRLIEEKSGKMRILKHTVTLQGIHGKSSRHDECLCYEEMGDCPRGELMYWREIWLERVNKRDHEIN